jgi:HlyD family secretion protein
VKKRIIGAVFLVLLVGVGILVYLGQRTVQLEELYYSGTIEARSSNLSFQVNGRVTDMPVDEGQVVQEDQVLAVLDQSEYQARFEQAEANLESAVRNLERTETVLALYKETLPHDVACAEAGLKVLLSQSAGD